MPKPVSTDELIKKLWDSHVLKEVTTRDIRNVTERLTEYQQALEKYADESNWGSGAFGVPTWLGSGTDNGYEIAQQTLNPTGTGEVK